MPEPVSMVSFYILSSLASALISSINGRKQRKLSEQTTEKTLSVQRDNLMMQLEHQKLLHEQGYKEQIANQLRAYELGNSWPLALSPQSIAGQITELDHVPLFLILAPMGKSGIQKELDNVWTDMKNFFIQTFKLDSETPVILGHYKNAWPVNPSSDYSIIWDGIRDVPTLYIAPYSTDRDGILGFTVAFWGMNSTAPKVQNFVLNIRKLYIDEIRKETKVFEQKCHQRIFELSDDDALAKNITIFANENARLANGATFEDLDQTINFYKDVKPTPNVLRSIANQVNPVIKTLSSSIVDMYFILEYGTQPLFPRIVRNIRENYTMPDLLTQGMLDDKPQFELLSGKKFLEDIYIDYSRFAAQHMEPLAGVQHLAVFKDALPLTGNIFEKVLAERCLPLNLSANEYSQDQKAFLDKISVIPGIENSEYFSKAIINKADSSSDDLYEKNNEYNQAQKYIAEKLYTEAIPLLKRASANNENAMYDLGICYLKGLGVERDLRQAQACFSICAEKHIKIPFRSIIEYCERIGMSDTQCIEFVSLVATCGDADTKFDLGVYFLKNGNLELSEKWFLASYKSGNEDAKEVLMEIQKQQGENEMKEKDEKGLFRKSVDAVVEGVFNVIDLFPRKYIPGETQSVTYDDLVNFAYKCKNQYPEIAACRVVCEFKADENRYRITQLALNSNGKVIVDGKNSIGRMFFANTLDRQIFTLCGNSDTASFDIPLRNI